MKGFTMCEFTRHDLRSMELALRDRLVVCQQNATKYEAYANATDGMTTGDTYRTHMEYWLDEYKMTKVAHDKVKVNLDLMPLVLNTTGKRISIPLQTSTPKYDGPTLT